MWLQRWEMDLRPLHEAKERSREMAHAYTKAGIQMMFLLNGGAIIAFPTFATMAGVKFTSHPYIALSSIALFVVGLVLIAVTTIYAYLSMDADKANIHQHSEVVKCRLNKEQDPQNKNADWDQRRMDAEKELSNQYQIASGYRRMATQLAIGSCVAFCIGAILAALVLAIAHT